MEIARPILSLKINKLTRILATAGLTTIPGIPILPIYFELACSSFCKKSLRISVAESSKLAF